MPRKKINITAAEKKIIIGILKKYIPGREARAFGSRVSGRVKKFSDLDIAIMGTEPVDGLVMADLKEEFLESDLPFKVDLVDWAKTKENFRRLIEKDYAVLKS